MPSAGTVDVEILEAFLDDADEPLEKWERIGLALADRHDAEAWSTLYRILHTLKGSSRCAGLQEFGHLIHGVEDAVGLLRDGTLGFNAGLEELFLTAHRFAAEWVAGLRSDPYLVPDHADLQERFATLTLAGEERGKVAVPVPGDPPTAGAAVAAGAGAPQNRATIRVDARKLDTLMNCIGELSVYQQILQHHLEHGDLDTSKAHATIHAITKVSRDLQSDSLVLRMQPIRSAFQRLERVARDVARVTGKTIHVTRLGEEVEIDNAILDRVFEPLLHVVRNCVDHGIEPSEERLAQAKDEAGQIHFEACQEAAGIRITISDDGRGLNTESILQKGIDKGLVAPGANPRREDIHSLILLPGFSTVTEVTEISGRGVGMDVLKASVDQMGGEIDIGSRPSEGTSLSIVLPTSLSFQDALVILVGSARHVVPVKEIVEVLDLQGQKLRTTLDGRSVFVLRDVAVPVHHLTDQLPTRPAPDVEGKSKGSKVLPLKPPRPALITQYLGRMLAFEVDGVLGMQSVVVRRLHAGLEQDTALAGTAILGDGRPGIVLNMRHLTNRIIDDNLRRGLSNG